MTWARLDDEYFTHRKTATLSKDAKLMDLAGIAFSARELRDGVLSRRDVRIVAAQVEVDDVQATVHELIAVGRWAVEGETYVIHDYLDYNPSREQVLRARAMTAERQARWRDNHPTNPGGNGVTATVSTADDDGVSARAPVPLNPVNVNEDVNDPGTSRVRAREAEPETKTKNNESARETAERRGPPCCTLWVNSEGRRHGKGCVQFAPARARVAVAATETSQNAPPGGNVPQDKPLDFPVRPSFGHDAAHYVGQARRRAYA